MVKRPSLPMVGVQPMNAGFQIPTRIETEPADGKFDPRTYINFVWRHWMLIASVTALVLLIAVINLVRATPLYTAATQVILEAPAKAPTDNGLPDYRYSDYSFIENQLAIIRSDPLLRRVVVKERLAGPPPTQKESQSTDPPKDGAPPTEDESVLEGINSLRGALAVVRSGSSQVLNISITWTDPIRAAQLANAVANAYVVNQLDARFESAKQASGWLSDRLVELRQQLRDSEEAVTKFRNEHGLVRSGPTIALNDQQLAELNNKLIAARTDAAEKKTRVDFLAEVSRGKKTTDSLPDTFQSSEQAKIMAALRGKLADVSQRQADLLARYSSRHPAVVNVEAEKQDIERSLAAETQRMVQAVNNEYALAKARLSATEQAMREATGQGGLSYDDSVRLRELERTAAVNKSLFEDFLQKAKITDEQSTFRPQEVRIIMPAQRGGQTFPNTRKALLTALFIGLGLGVGGAFAMEKLNAGFTTPRQVEDALGVPVLASLHRMDRGRLLSKDGKTIPLVYYYLHYPLSAFSESVRTLRSGIHMSDVDRPPKVIQVTSSRPGEGKTTIAMSLAISAAFSGLKVALVDADLRHPSVSRFFKLEQAKGLVDYLIGAAAFETVVRFQNDLKVVVIPAGSKSLNPTDVLGSERMKALVSHLKETFDYVVLDTPPVGPVVDPVIVTNLVDKTLFVVRWASTPRELVETCLQQVSTHKRVAGVALNSVNQDRARKYGGEHYYGKRYEKYYSEA
jgi:capsular exopolysaccharide synthesis family protein